MSREKVYLALVFGILCISSSSILVKDLELRGLPLLGVACYRMVFAAILLGIPAIIWQRRELFGLDRTKLLVLITGGIFLALHFGSWTVSLHYIPVARSVLLVTCHPIFTALASRIFLKERLSARNIAAVVIAFGGIIVIISESAIGTSGNNLSLFGDMLALIGAIAIVGYIIIGKKLRAGMSLLSYSSIVYTTCALILWPASLLAGAHPQQFSANDYLLLIALAIVPTLGGHTVFNLLLKDVSATLISIAFLGEPLGAALLAWLRWGQIPSQFTIAGGLLVMLGIYLVKIESDKVSTAEA
jgi:drug/metabolite transporter (DMT)-like permease